MSDEPTAFEAFVQLNRSQLAGIPESLWNALHTKLVANTFGASSAFSTPPIRAIIPLAPHSDIFIFPHVWTFRSISDAREHLSNPALVASASAILQLVDTLEGVVDEGNEVTADTIVGNLYRIAYQYQLSTPDPATAGNYYYVTTDPSSPAFMPYERVEPRVWCGVFVDIERSRAVSVAYPLRELCVGDNVTRSELTPMPDYAAKGYWERLYRGGGESEWFVGWEAVKGIVGKAVEKGGMCLNLGCGLSGVGGEMVRDETVGGVWSVDIAPSAVEELARREGTKRGVHEFLCLDAMRIPWRDRTVDLVFDKGMLDGILYHADGVEMVRRVWDEAARLLVPEGRLILVSLGAPENRINLVETKLGWEVIDAFEVENKNRAELAKGGIERCFVYVCGRP